MTSLLTAEGLTGLIFLVVVGITIAGAIIATNSTKPVRAVAGLAIACIGIAGLYYYLLSPFVALMELLIYVGAVCVVIVFAVMLADPKTDVRVWKRNALAGALSFSVGALLFWVLAALGIKTSWVAAPVKVNNGSLVEVGRALLTSHSMVFELISLVLLVAIIGSLVLARAGRDR